MTDIRLNAEEARRTAHRDAVKGKVDREVNAKIAARTEQTTSAEANAMDNVAREFRGKAIGELASQDREVRRARVLARVAQIIDYVFFLVYGLLGIRLGLALIGARTGSGFVKLIHAITAPVYSMFEGTVSSPSLGGFTLALPIVIAIGVYALLHLGIKRLLRLIALRKTEI